VPGRPACRAQIPAVPLPVVPDVTVDAAADTVQAVLAAAAAAVSGSGGVADASQIAAQLLQMGSVQGLEQLLSLGQLPGLGDVPLPPVDGGAVAAAELTPPVPLSLGEVVAQAGQLGGVGSLLPADGGVPAGLDAGGAVAGPPPSVQATEQPAADVAREGSWDSEADENGGGAPGTGLAAAHVRALPNMGASLGSGEVQGRRVGHPGRRHACMPTRSAAEPASVVTRRAASG
jgi:hypothetical protein